SGGRAESGIVGEPPERVPEGPALAAEGQRPLHREIRDGWLDPKLGEEGSGLLETFSLRGTDAPVDTAITDARGEPGQFRPADVLACGEGAVERHEHSAGTRRREGGPGGADRQAQSSRGALQKVPARYAASRASRAHHGAYNAPW